MIVSGERVFYSEPVINKKLTRAFYTRPTLQVAKDLLGKFIVRQTPQGKIVGQINEVEAYLGEKDPASHAFRGQTPRNAPMFLSGGHAYVYFIYGMHHCMNIVTEQTGRAGAVLIRSIIPIEGLDLIRKNRHQVKDNQLTNGPGKICQALAIDRQQSGLDLVTSQELWLENRGAQISKIQKTPRIGIRTATDKLWRFTY